MNRFHSKLWAPHLTPPARETPALPLKSLLPPAVLPRPSDPERQRRVFEEILQNLRNHLFQAESHALAAGDWATELKRRRNLCREAVACYERALKLLGRLRALTSCMGLEDRRRFRAVEGAPQWRAVRRAIAAGARQSGMVFPFAA